MINIKAININSVRFFGDKHRESMLTRYNILKEDITSEGFWTDNVYTFDDTKITKEDNLYTLEKENKSIRMNLEELERGYKITIFMNDDERIFGLGDSERENLMIRGKKRHLHVTSVTAYGPIPYIMSSAGWGFLLNTTYDSYFDIGAENKNEINIFVKKGRLDFYLFTGNSMKEVLGAYTTVSGKPTMLPAFAYGLTFVTNDINANARTLLWDCKTMRERDIPCDVVGLEPDWMETYYDTSTKKEWSKDRFFFHRFFGENDGGKCMFTYALRQMGYKLSLWLCNDYDLFYKEENEEIVVENDYDKTQAAFVDEHFNNKIMMDKITIQGEAWFEHLKKFVDNGASCFKLDAAYQVNDHPDRFWACKFKDEEAHNAYTVVLAKQMNEGFAEHTDRRPFVYSAGQYAGIQQYVATWAGDTGGGLETVLSVFNHAMCGHTNTACDIEVGEPESIHYGFLLTWAQLFNWAQYREPWFLKKEDEDMIRDYSKLRSSLFPYIYSMAHKAAVTGIPVVRPLSLEYEDTDEFDNVQNLYMLGDNLLIGVFDMHFKLPEGVWVDYFTNKEYSGEFDYEIPEGKGGAIFVKKGSVFVTMEPQNYILEKEHDHIINVFPGNEDEFTLYEDDMYTYGYKNGEFAETKIRLGRLDDNKLSLSVDMRTGDFKGRPDNGHDDLLNSIPEIKGMGEIRDMLVKLNGCEIANVTLNGSEVEFDKDTFVVDAESHKNDNLTYVITLN